MAKRGMREEVDLKEMNKAVVEKWRNLLTTAVEYMLCAEQEDIAQDEPSLQSLIKFMKVEPKVRNKVLELLDEILDEIHVEDLARSSKPKLTERIADFRHVASTLVVSKEDFMNYIEASTEEDENPL